MRDTVEGYNRDDCVSTLRLRDWLETVRQQAIEAGADVPRPTLAEPEPSAELSEKQQRTEALRRQLLDGIDGIPAPASTAHARWLLAYMLDFHRREEKSGWWKYYKILECTDEELIDEPDAIVGLEFVAHADIVRHARTGQPTGSVIDRYRYPQQEIEIDKGDDLKCLDKTSFGKVMNVDRTERTIEVKKSKASADVHPASVFAHTFIPSDPIPDAIADVAQSVLGEESCDGANGIARALLLREPPRVRGGTFLQPADCDIGKFAIDSVVALDHSVLAIQGPPGSGKTFTGARMICSLVAGREACRCARSQSQSGGQFARGRRKGSTRPWRDSTHCAEAFE